MRRVLRPLILAAGAAFLLLSGPARATLLIFDDFEVDSSASYSVSSDGAPDGSVTFAFDYVAASIPLAPHSAAGDRSGLRFTANDSLAATDAFTAFHETSLSGDFTLWVDVYLGVTGTGGTTEHAHVGVGGDGSTFNQYSTPTSGSGAFAAFDGDGGSSSFDYAHFTEEGGLIATTDASYLAGGGNNLEALYQGIFPGTNGSPTNLWTTLRIDVVGGTSVTYSLDGTPIIVASTSHTDGFVSLGYADVFTSLADPAQSQFVIYDNLRVVPEPASSLLLATGLLLLAAVRRGVAH